MIAGAGVYMGSWVIAGAGVCALQRFSGDVLGMVDDRNVWVDTIVIPLLDDDSDGIILFLFL